MTKLVFLFFLSFSVYGDAFFHGDYINYCSKPVMLTVPYYSGEAKEKVALDISLGHGDFYHARKGKNGYICEKFSLMPDIATNEMHKIEYEIPLLYNSFKNERDEEYLKIHDALISTNIPGWWIQKCKKDYQYWLKTFERHLKQYEEKEKSGVINDFWRKNALNNMRYWCSITNLNEQDLEKLIYPFADLDGDGINNMEELYCGSAPYLKNGIVLEPGLMEITPDGNPFITNVFYVTNLTDTNVVIIMSGPSTNDKNYSPKIKSIGDLKIVDNSKNLCVNWIIDLPPKTKNKFLAIFEADYLPLEMSELYHVQIMDKFYLLRGEMKMHISEDYSKRLSKPKAIGPKNGTHSMALDNINFIWDDSESYDFRSGNESDILFKIQYYNIDDDCIWYSMLTREKSKIENISVPGNYIWRVLKGTSYTKSVASDWHWFSLGKEISPLSDKILSFAKYTEYKDQNGNTIHEHILNKNTNYEQQLYSTNNVRDRFFKINLPDGLDIEKRNGFWTVFGYPQQTGQYKYVWYVKKTDGTVETNRHTFTIYDSEETLIPSTYYHLNKKTVVHNLRCNIPYDYEAKTYYDCFSTHDERMNFDNTCDAWFCDKLPKGLEGTMTNGNYIVRGIPQNSQVTTNVFVVQKNGKEIKERHVFNISPLKLPTIIPVR